MKIMVITFVVGLSLAGACTHTTMPDKEVISVPEEHNMKIIPPNPGSNDEIKLVILDDCNYNVLTGVTRSGNTIDIVKQFNGMMKRPCFITNDTISLGKLPQGSYTIHYKLKDIGYTPPTTTLSLTFILNVL